MKLSIIATILLLSSSSAKHKSSKRSSKSGKQCALKKLPSSKRSKEPEIDCDVDITTSLDDIVHVLAPGNAFAGTVIEQNDTDDNYKAASKQYSSASFITKPSYIVQASNEVDVQAAVMYSGSCGYKVTARSGGHSYIGTSSCDSSEGNCIQLDIRGLQGIEFIENKKVRVGAGVRLEELAEKNALEGVFVPGGECTAIGISGHMQTGGFGPFGRSLGAFAHYVQSFKIVLADGSLKAVEKPTDETDKLNDDLFYAVLGGASGSFGVITEVTLSTLNDDDYYVYYWEVNFLYDNTTIEGIKRMFRKFTELAIDNEDNSSWNIVWSVVGSKTLLEGMKATGRLPGFFETVNYIQLDYIWVQRKNQGLDESEVLEKAEAFYNYIVIECGDCLLNDYFDAKYPVIPFGPFAETLKTNLFPSTGADRATSVSLSELYKEVVLFDYSKFEVDSFPARQSWQQGHIFPSADDIEEIFMRIDKLVPKIGNEPVFTVSQWFTTPSQFHTNPDISLPFQDDKFGFDVSLRDLTGGIKIDDFESAQREIGDLVISAVGGVDHRMFWSAYENPSFPKDRDLYYDSNSKYQRLVGIKTCVDPNNVFENRMSLPVSVGPRLR